MEYNEPNPAVPVVLPLMLPGCAGMDNGFTVNPEVVPDPQLLLAFTVIWPEIVEAVALMEGVDELPLHPEGKVQI